MRPSLGRTGMATESSGSKLIVRNLTKSFRRQRDDRVIKVFDGISLDVHPSEFVCLVGPSGCGKTTLLRILNGPFC